MAGLLVEKVGGASVRPYQPEGLWDEVGEGGLEYVRAEGDDLYRRSLYTFWKRRRTTDDVDFRLIDA